MKTWNSSRGRPLTTLHPQTLETQTAGRCCKSLLQKGQYMFKLQTRRSEISSSYKIAREVRAATSNPLPRTSKPYARISSNRGNSSLKRTCESAWWHTAIIPRRTIPTSLRTLGSLLISVRCTKIYLVCMLPGEGMVLKRLPQHWRKL